MRQSPPCTSASPANKLTAGRLLLRNTTWNFLSTAVPLLVALFAFPMLIEGMGIERFGVLTLAWVVIGYFSLFNLGLGRAMTKLVADKLGSGELSEIPSIAWTALWLMLLLGCIGGSVLALISPWLVLDVLNIPQVLHSETINTFYLLAFSVPVVIGTVGLRGLLEAHQKFFVISVVRVFAGVFSLVAPLFVLPFSQNLFDIVGVLVAGLVFTWGVHWIICIYMVPELRKVSIQLFAWKVVKPLFSFGAWMTVTNTISPLMVYFDRFLIGAAISITAVAYYTTPYEVVTKLWIIPSSLLGVLFPAFVTSLAQDRKRASRLFRHGIHTVFILLFPVVIGIILFSEEILSLWINKDFSINSYHILKWLAVGVFINSLAQVPFILIQSIGRPDITAKLHFAELVLYIPALWRLVDLYGIEGAAIAWVLRVGIDGLLLFVLVEKILPYLNYKTLDIVRLLIPALTLFAICWVTETLISKILVYMAITIVFVGFVWYVLFEDQERDWFCSIIARNRCSKSE